MPLRKPSGRSLTDFLASAMVMTLGAELHPLQVYLHENAAVYSQLGRVWKEVKTGYGAMPDRLRQFAAAQQGALTA